MSDLPVFHRLDEIESNVMSELKDFQQETVKRIDYLYNNGQKRILVSDEVGLGKTLIARGTIAKFAKLRKKEGDDLVKVVYICSNASIAQQNLEKLKIVNEVQVSNSNTSRLSMQHLNIFKDENDKKVRENYIQIIPLTPQTSFKITNSQGLAEERALMYTILKHLPDFEGYENKLSEFLRCGVKYWEKLVDDYDTEVNECDCKSKVFGEKVNECNEESENFPKGYLGFMCCKLSHSLKNHEFLTELMEYLEKDEFDCYESKPFIIELRKIFTEISLDKLDPDLIIMDEFQRFNYLLSADTGSDMDLLINKFFNNNNKEDLRILLLSATPYKMYSTLDEINETHVDEHYKEFFKVMDFLNTSEDDKNNFNTIWSNYSMKLKEINSGTDSFILAKNEAEDALYKNICRTERITEAHAAELIDDNDKYNLLKVFKNDINSYIEFEKLLQSIDIDIKTVPVDYIKSSPYLMSFMDNYKLKGKIVGYFGNHPQEIYKIFKKMNRDVFWINDLAIENYKKIEFNHARLCHLMKNVFKDNAELLLWVPPSKGYYSSEGVFEGIQNFSKTLIFSSWEMVPRMISTLVSYETERRTIGKLPKDNQNITYSKSKYSTSNRIRYQIKENKPSTMNLLSLIYPSSYLSMVYVPIECLNKDLSLGEIENKLKKRIGSQLEQLDEELNLLNNDGFKNSDGSSGWYYLAPLLLDCLDEKSKHLNSEGAGSCLKWYDCTKYVRNWFNEFKNYLKEQKEEDKEKRQNKQNFEKHIAYLEETFDALVDYAKKEDEEFVSLNNKDSNILIDKLGRKPDDLVDVLVDIAIASPANCIYRSYRRELSSYGNLNLTISKGNENFDSNEELKGELAKEMKKYVHLCSKFSFNFLSMMNDLDSMATIDTVDQFYGLSGDAYWKKILTYSKQGNLQAVFDEYVYLLSNGLDKNNENRINIIHEKFLGSMNFRKIPYSVETFDDFKSEIYEENQSEALDEDNKKMKIRTHFAVPFAKGAGNDADTNRKTSVRDAFNSPFRPFVLASTSIGQEGLDFHNYCRRIVHWNLPSNPIDLEQREGRINRFACLAIRQNIAERYGLKTDEFENNIWIEMFAKAIKEKEKIGGVSDLIPFWGLTERKDMIKIERILPFYPFSIDQEKYNRLINILLVYRLTLGQPRQEELVKEIMKEKKLHERKDLFINLSPYYKKEKA